MKTLFKILIIVFLFSIALMFTIKTAFASYNDPSEFGNLSTTTVWIGGSQGIVNATGNITGAYFYGDGKFITNINESPLNVNSSDYWDSHGTLSDIYYKVLSYWQNITGRPTHLSNFTLDITVGNTSADMIRATQDTFVNKSGDDMTGDLNFDDASSITNLRYIWLDNIYHDGDPNTYMSFGTDTIHFIAGANVLLSIYEAAQNYVIFNMNNADVDFIIDTDTTEAAFFIDGAGEGKMSLAINLTTSKKLQVDNNINVSGDINSSQTISAEIFRDKTDGIEWIKPEHILDVDKEDIETDLNTFVDIDGDSMTGNLVTTADIEVEGGGICIDSGGCAVSADYFEIEAGAMCIDSDGSLDCSSFATAGDLFLMDGTMKVMSGGTYTCTQAVDDGELCVEYDIEAGGNIQSGGWINATKDINSSKNICDMYNCMSIFANTTGDPLTGDLYFQSNLHINQSKNNITLMQNSSIVFNNTAEIYYDGTKLVIKVS